MLVRVSCHPRCECCPFFDFLFLTLFLSVCFSCLFFFHLNLELNLFLHVAVLGAIFHWLLQMRSLAPWPKIPDDFHYSETTEIFFQEESGDAVPSYLCDTELDDETISRTLSSPMFIQEANLRQAYHSFEESLLPSQSLSVCHVRTGRLVDEFSSLSSCREKPSREMENETIRILLERQKEQILADF